jgi:predicted Holliday junction resolvase-like endonuclease
MDTGIFGVAGVLVLLCLAGAIFAFQRYLRLHATMQEAVQRQVSDWKQRDWEQLLTQSRQAALAEAEADLARWRTEQEIAIREDAVKRSFAVISGKVAEHLAPYFGDFPFSPKDVRFLGSPVDLVVFDGLDEGNLREVVLVEIKTASSSLTRRECQIRDAAQSGRIRWLEYRPMVGVAPQAPPPDHEPERSVWYRKE